MESYLPRARASLERMAPLRDEAWGDFSKYLTPRVLGRDEFFARAGEPAELIAFVAEGAVREYYITSDGREYNKAFVLAGEFTGSLFDLLSNQPSTAYIQALRETMLLTARFRDLTGLYERHPDWQRLGRFIAEALFMKKARREYEFLTMDAANRYEALLRRYPDLEEHVPQYHIASYLGITPVALSRIRKANPRE